MSTEKNRLVIKGTLLTHPLSFKVGEEIFSSQLLSVMNSWYSYTYNNFGEPIRELTVLQLREYGKIKLALNGYTNDLHNITINYCLFREIIDDRNIGFHRSNLYLALLIENIFINLRSIYDFFYHFIKICLSDFQLKQYPDKDSINNVINYSKKINNLEKLPFEIVKFLEYISPDLEDIKIIRDNIIHKGKDIMLTRESDRLLMRIPIKDLYTKDNLLPNILETEDLNYDVLMYIDKIIKTTFTNMEILAEVLFHEVHQYENFRHQPYAITNYCIDDFNDFLILGCRMQ
ncbi:hypothetical protein [Chryseobacterium aquaticum]|uniref:Cthe-2314-like HEPN domain-containing protein n=1 Tax=Chryseobacterium aquaticum subsp. greenlandense TaxID=345663 RepID=A0A101CG78_9FLAO|nr:hypothetical protein [Chryseobacterium aquaticum]KUJ55628.1 hypothetical protein AR686_12520 [Chryseobacterium aquaticum subsp. greenlandense]